MQVVDISVIIAAYNAEEYIGQCLESFVSQTFRNFELIVVDDGSADHTAEIAERFAGNDSRIRLIRNEHAGAAHARNTGMAAARGDYFLFFDADDFADPEALQIMYSGCTQHQADLCVVGSRSLDMETGKTADMTYTIKRDLLPEDNPFHPLEEMPDRIFLAFNGWAWDKLIARRLLERWGAAKPSDAGQDSASDGQEKSESEGILLPFQEIRTSNDMAFTDTALALAETVYVDPAVCLTHRDRVKGSLSNSRENSWDCFYLALRELRERLIRLGLMEKAEASYVQWAADFVQWNLNSLDGMPFAKAYQLMHEEGIRNLGILSAPESAYQGAYLDARSFCQNVQENNIGERFRQLGREEYDLHGTQKELQRMYGECAKKETVNGELWSAQKRLEEDNGRLSARAAELEQENSRISAEKSRMETDNRRLAEDNARLEAEREAVYRSKTWKVGHAVLYVPIKIADAIHGRRGSGEK